MYRSDPVIIEALRSPMGKYGGALSSVRPDDLASYVIKALLEKTCVPVEQIEDVVLGCANQAGEDNRNVARMAVLLSGLPQSVAGVTINRLCASGLEAINYAGRSILAGEGDVFVAGGVESMSRAPWVFPKAETAFAYGNKTVYDSALGWRFPNPKMKQLFPLEPMGDTAENIHDKYPISREEQDQFALESHQKAWNATRSSRFEEEIVPVKSQENTVAIDETIRPDTSLEKLASLKPVFREQGTVTAGNSSSLNDGAAAILMMSENKAKTLGLKPIARWVASAVAGCDPRFMGLGPVFAVKKLLARTGISLDQIDLIEINEAFAIQALACVKELGCDGQRVNVNGGAIALGHPLGCSGARILTTLLHEMKRRQGRFGLASLCVGVGQGVATLVELCDQG